MEELGYLGVYNTRTTSALADCFLDHNGAIMTDSGVRSLTNLCRRKHRTLLITQSSTTIPITDFKRLNKVNQDWELRTGTEEDEYYFNNPN